MGKLQRELFGIILDHGEPMTFVEILTRWAGVDTLRVRIPRLERNFRRAIHGMVRRGELIVLGEGGRKKPHRYFFHPLLLETHRDTEALQAALKADTGAEQAVAIDDTKLSIALKRALAEMAVEKASAGTASDAD